MEYRFVEMIPPAAAPTGKTPAAVYCRVSTKSRNQEDSFENQVAHYREKLSADPGYELVGIYGDLGISGFKETRPGFIRMMEDAEAGLFQRIITKSVTRFARNTKTILEVTRRLRELGIGVYFELQGIDTLSNEGELLITLYAAFGQAESEGARVNTLMALHRRFEEGDPVRRLERSMGYERDGEGGFRTNEFAPLVRLIFEMAADGFTPSKIAGYLNECGVTTHNGCAFHRGSLTRMLRNPAYKGDFQSQRYYVNEDRRIVPNRGEKPMLYIEDDHTPIVTEELWDAAQRTLDAASRAKQKNGPPAEDVPRTRTVRAGSVFCALCGHRLIRSVRHGKVVWECEGKARFSKSFCEGVTLTDDELADGLPPAGTYYVAPVSDRGMTRGHRFICAGEWLRTHEKKRMNPAASAPPLNEENYPYKDRIFCKYCGGRLRRIVTDSGKVVWICDTLSRQGKAVCRGVRIPDEKLAPLRDADFCAYIGKETDDGKESYGYTRQPDKKNGFG